MILFQTNYLAQVNLPFFLLETALYETHDIH